MPKIIKSIIEIFKVSKSLDHLGDIAILKSFLKPMRATRDLEYSLLESFNPQHHDFLKGRKKVDFNESSLGYSYFNFLESQSLSPIFFSGVYNHLINEKTIYATCYASVHDFYHVVSGFDASLVGEAGVWAILAGQDQAPSAKKASDLTSVLYPAFKMSIQTWKDVKKAKAIGLQIGREAQSMIEYRWFDKLDVDLEQVKNELNIQINWSR